MKARVAGVFDRASDSYDRVDVDYFGVFGQRLVEIAKIAPGERVLDVGCGRGAALFPAARAVGPTGNVIGVDLAPGMVARTRAEAAEQGLSRVTVRVGDAEFPDATDHEYDAVLSAFVLFFLPDLKPVLRRYLDALRPGGRVAISWWGEDDPRWRPVFEAAWAHIPNDHAVPDYRAAKADAEALMDRVRETDGSLAGRAKVRYTVARAPGQ